MMWALIVDALESLYAARQRSALALLGIVIGTASVIAMLTIGHSAQSEALRTFRTMGTDVLVLNEAGASSDRTVALAAEDIASLSKAVPAIAADAPILLVGERATRGRQAADLTVVGTTSLLIGVVNLQLRTGRFLSPFDGSRAVAVLGDAAAQELAGTGPSLRVENTFRLGEHEYTVVGILAPFPTNPLLPVNFDHGVVVPLRAMQRQADAKITTVLARMRPGADDAVVTAEVEHHFAARPRAAGVVVQSARQLLVAIAKQADVYTLLLSAIGGISLLVGGVGVMNVMLMGLAERRREIGLRMALGARRRDIRWMFLVEALVLSLFGGLFGTVLGLLAAWIYARASDWSFSLSPIVLPLGAGMALAVGLFFGAYPAARAARLDPIVALRGD